MAYREAAGPTEETLDVFDVSLTKGAEAMGCLGALALTFLVALVVSLVAGAPPEIEPWIWTFPVAAGLCAVPLLWMRQRRKRKLSLVRSGDTVKLLVSGGVELRLPVVLTGSQVTIHMRGVPMHHVYLKLVDAAGKGILLSETRGAIHGSVEGWLSAIDTTTPASSFEVGLNDAARIRARVEELNRGATPP